MYDQYSHVAVTPRDRKIQSPIDLRHRAKKPRGRYDQVLQLIGYGRAPKSPQAAAMDRM